MNKKVNKSNKNFQNYILKNLFLYKVKKNDNYYINKIAKRFFLFVSRMFMISLF